MKNLILIICCVFCCSSCWRFDLDSQKSVMTDSLLAHFPESSLTFFPYGGAWSEEVNSEMYRPNDIAPFLTIYIYKCHNFSRMNHLIQQYKKESLFTIMSEDTTYLTIERGYTLRMRYENQNMDSIYVRNKNPLILRYDQYLKFYDPRTLCNLEPGWTICVLKSGSEFILSHEKKYDFNTLPPSYQHGYSSGVAFNEKEHKKYLICWAVAW